MILDANALSAFAEGNLRVRATQNCYLIAQIG